MAEPKPLPDCSQCDHLCDQTDDGECLGNLTKEERQTIYWSISQAYLSHDLEGYLKTLKEWGVLFYDKHGNVQHDP